MTRDQVAAFRLGRQHLARRTSSGSLVSVVGDMAGAQAQLLSAAQISLAARTVDLTVEQVEAALAERHLVTLACMRRTLHVVPSRLAAVFVRGTARRAEKDVRWAIGKGVPARTVETAIDAALDALDEPLTRPEIAERVCRMLGRRPRVVHGGGWGSRGKIAAVPVGALTYPVVDLLHLAAARGVVCHGPRRNGEPTFVRADVWAPGYEDVIPEEAETLLLRRYLDAFAPATAADFAAWTGITLRESAGIWTRVADDLEPVVVEGSEAAVPRAGVDELACARTDHPHVRLLPYFDAYLLGHRDRSQIVSEEHRHRVSRPQGWIAPVVLVDGTAAGVWKHVRERGRLVVDVTLFRRLSRVAVAALRREAEALRRFLGAQAAEVRIGSGLPEGRA